MTKQPILLGVNIDHVATLRQARGTRYPEPVQAALLAEQAGADGITAHLREDRRHIQDRDIRLLKELLHTRLNLEMAVTEPMLAIACAVQPHACCLVPERREELTTEGGLDVAGAAGRMFEACRQLARPVSKSRCLSIPICAKSTRRWPPVRRWSSCIPAAMPMPKLRASANGSCSGFAMRRHMPRRRLTGQCRTRFKSAQRRSHLPDRRDRRIEYRPRLNRSGFVFRSGAGGQGYETGDARGAFARLG